MEELRILDFVIDYNAHKAGTRLEHLGLCRTPCPAKPPPGEMRPPKIGSAVCETCAYFRSIDKVKMQLVCARPKGAWIDLPPSSLRYNCPPFKPDKAQRPFEKEWEAFGKRWSEDLGFSRQHFEDIMNRLTRAGLLKMRKD